MPSAVLSLPSLSLSLSLSSQTLNHFFLLFCLQTQAVSACIYGAPSGGDPLETVQLEEVNGVWSFDGPRSWEGCYYQYAVSVYHPSTLKIENCMATAYARRLSSYGRRTLLINLDCENLKPERWDDLANEKPELSSFSDISIYELHIRDFRTRQAYFISRN